MILRELKASVLILTVFDRKVLSGNTPAKVTDEQDIAGKEKFAMMKMQKSEYIVRHSFCSWPFIFFFK